MTINYQQPFTPFPSYGYYPFPQTPMQNAPQGSFHYGEQSYIENIIRLNKGKTATIYMNFEGSQWGSKIFRGTLVAAGKDHIIIKDLQSEVRYLLLTIYLSYITFDEEIEYEYPYE